MQITNTIGSIAIGSFDGIHRAHQVLIDRVEAVAVIERGGGYLTPGFKRSWYTSKPMFFYLFEQIKSLEPEGFVSVLKEDFPGLKKIVVGYDFAFGKGRKGDVQTLRGLFDGEVDVVDEVKVEGVSVHSRTIKALLQEGGIERANMLLGRSYRIDGMIVKGQGLGSKELYPTLNLKIQAYQLPKDGVYVTTTEVDGGHYASVTFLGTRGTDGRFSIETHCLDVRLCTESEKVFVRFHKRLRDNRNFQSITALKRQIEHDIKEAKTYHAKR